MIMIILAVAGFLAAAPAAAQTAGGVSFDALPGRIQVGQVIWVTDLSGREVQGSLERISGAGLDLKTDSLRRSA